MNVISREFRMVRNVRIASALVMSAVLAGCASTPAPRWYVFAPRDGWQQVAVRDVESSDYTLRFAAIKLPPYLDRPQIVTRVSDNEIKVDQFHRWGMPLNQTILELLGGAIAQELPNAYVDVIPATSRLPLGYLVQVEIVRLDGFPGGPVEVIAQWRVQRGGPEPITIVQKLGRHEHVSSDRSYDAYVESIRHVLVEMGADIAAAIVRDSASTTPPLDGSAWVLSSLPGRSLVAGATPTARFEDGRVSGSDGCNRYAMPFVEHGSAIQIGPQGPSTLMACEEETMAQAEAFRAALLAARRVRHGAESLELLDANGAAVATLAAQAGSLAGTSWNVIHINTGQAIVGVLSDSTVNLVFDAEGRASGSAGCNQYTVAYSADGDSLSFSRVAATRMACPDPSVMEQEAAFLRALEWVKALQFENDRLDLLQEDGSIAMVLARAPGAVVME